MSYRNCLLLNYFLALFFRLASLVILILFKFFLQKKCKLYLINKEAFPVLCPFVKSAGSGRAREKGREKQESWLSVSLYILSALQNI